LFVRQFFGAGLAHSSYLLGGASNFDRGDFGPMTFPELLRVNPWVVIVPLAATLIGFLFWLERTGL